MLTIQTVFTSLVALHALLASTGQGYVEASVLRRDSDGHGARHSQVIRGLLNVAGRDGTFTKRQGGTCDSGFFPCSDGTGCCQIGQTCDNLPDGTPTCCCTTGGNCPSGYLPCSGNTAICCPKGDICTSTGGCVPAGSSGGGGSGGTGGSGTTGGGGAGGFTTLSTTPKGPATTFTSPVTSSPAFGNGGGGLSGSTTIVPAVVTVTSTAGSGSSGSSGSSGTNLKNGETSLKAGMAVVVLSGVMVASGLTVLAL